AGNGVGGFGGDGGPATQANLLNPYGVAVGPDGSLYIADTGNDRIRKVWPSGVITTVAGIGEKGFTGDDGPAISANITTPLMVAVGLDGSLYIADSNNNRIRRVGPDGIITTVAGNGASSDGEANPLPATQMSLKHPAAVTVSSDGSLYIADSGHHRILRVG